ncbi:MAG TPA: GcrA family cell cycle regulator [Pseudonocardiaceae bacterium]|jgi:hypothetical protein|nr:GcrA family cell cycle regulator [Pseudonocardiaceae bacterium]
MHSKPLTDAEVEQIRVLHGQGMSRNEIAAQVGRSVGSVTNVASRLGLSFDRTATKAATAAKVADARSKRAEEMNALLDDARRLRLQLFEPCLVHSFGGKDNTYAEAHLQQPPFADQAKIMQAYNLAMSNSLRLDQHDGDGSVEQMGSLLGSMLDTLVERHAAPADDGD